MRRLSSPDGVEVAVHDLGGSGPDVLLVHATGFCGTVFAPLAAHLRDAFRCWAVDLRGHGLSGAPAAFDDGWQGFADDVLTAVDGLGLERPVAVGHSCGGAATLLAEANRPGTFRFVWCYEPIVWPDPEQARSRAERLARGARRRRDQFPSRQDAYENFAAKPPFSTLAPAALRAYVDCGFADEDDGSVRLRCRPDVEAEVYRQAVTLDRFGRLGEVDCPVVVASGGRTDAITPALAAQLAEALPRGRVEVYDHLAHFGPLEDPAAAAASIRGALARG